MLLRASNAVGYKNYPDNVIREFVAKSAESGIDVFRIFDSLNWIKGMEVAIDAVRQSGKIAEAAVCYTGDITDPMRSKYDINYYKNMARELEAQGAHILAIKDMAGLLKPQAAYQLISELKETVNIPIHLHTHDTSGNGIYTYAKAIEAGVDIVDTAVSTMAGMTSQPSANTLYYALEGSERQPDVNIESLEVLSHYWEDVRKYYQDFESGMNSSTYRGLSTRNAGRTVQQYCSSRQKQLDLGDEWDKCEKDVCSCQPNVWRHCESNPFF